MPTLFTRYSASPLHAASGELRLDYPPLAILLLLLSTTQHCLARPLFSIPVPPAHRLAVLSAGRFNRNCTLHKTVTKRDWMGVWCRRDGYGADPGSVTYSDFESQSLGLVTNGSDGSNGS